jgi:hypothetical protein
MSTIPDDPYERELWWNGYRAREEDGDPASGLAVAMLLGVMTAVGFIAGAWIF